MTNLDDLLSTPLAKIADDHFSEQVLKRINNYYRWRELVLKSLSVILVLLFIVLSSPVILLSQFNKVSNFLALKLTHFFQLDSLAIFSQISQQPVLWLVLIISLVLIFTPQNH